jgi:hypothetical protein
MNRAVSPRATGKEDVLVDAQEFGIKSTQTDRRRPSAGPCRICCPLKFENSCQAWPRHRAGFSPLRRPLALAASSTRSMRPRTRDAVSWRVSQIGRKTSSTSSVPISFSNLGRSGAAWVLSVDSHCSRCLAFRNPDEILVTSSSANSPNVFVPALDRLSVSGSVPLKSKRRASAALRRASCNERPGFFGPGDGPRPISRSVLSFCIGSDFV